MKLPTGFRIVISLFVFPGATVYGATACGQKGPPEGPLEGPPGWFPVDRTTLPAFCGGALEPNLPGPRASSLRRGPCDYGEAPDVTVYDLFPGEEIPPQTGDGLCHRVCDDGACVPGEACESRPMYVSDTPTRYANLCTCSGEACAERAPSDTPEGGLDAWRDEAPMPVDLYHHAAASDERHLFVSGGLKILAQHENSTELDFVDDVYVADLDNAGVVSGWRPAGKLPSALTQHAMTVAGGRLYVAGGDVRPSSGIEYTAAVVSYAIEEDGSLGPARDEAPLPQPRVRHALLADGRRLIVASGETIDFSGTPEIAFATASEGDGRVQSWSVANAPTAVYHDSAAGIANGTLYLYSAWKFYDPSMRALLALPLADLSILTRPDHFEHRTPWAGHPETLSSENETVRLVGVCDALVLMTNGGAVATAPIDAKGKLGDWRAASRFVTISGGYAVTYSPSGRVYVTGGFNGSPQENARVRSTRRM